MERDWNNIDTLFLVVFFIATFGSMVILNKVWFAFIGMGVYAFTYYMIRTKKKKDNSPTRGTSRGEE